MWDLWDQNKTSPINSWTFFFSLFHERMDILKMRTYISATSEKKSRNLSPIFIHGSTNWHCLIGLDFKPLLSYNQRYNNADLVEIIKSIPLSICTWFFKYLVHEIELYFWALFLNWIFADYTGSKNQVWNRQKSWCTTIMYLLYFLKVMWMSRSSETNNQIDYNKNSIAYGQKRPCKFFYFPGPSKLLQTILLCFQIRLNFSTFNFQRAFLNSLLELYYIQLISK